MSNQPTHLAVCGDSFSVGHGLDSAVQIAKSYGGLIAEHYNLPQKVYGRSGCCNFVIYLQVKKIIEQLNKNFKPFVVVNDTWYERIIFPVKHSWFDTEPDLSDVDYLNYSPYKEGQELPFKTKKNFKFVSEGLRTFFKGKEFGLNQLYDKCREEHKSGIDAYFNHIHDPMIKREIDRSLIASAHSLLLQNNVPHVFILREKNPLINEKNAVIVDWNKLVKKYPDALGTGHCSEQGHNIVAEKVINWVDNQGLITS